MRSDTGLSERAFFLGGCARDAGVEAPRCACEDLNFVPLRISHLIPCTEAEGPHRRVALWVTGCSIRCPGCCNPELFDADAGQRMEIAALVERIEHAASLHGVEGVTLVGGEPLEQLDGVTALCAALRERLPALGILIFTGMQLHAHPDPDGLRVLLDLVDTVVEGPFEASRAHESTT